VNFACDACQKRYSIADEKVQGRSFRVTCKQCGHVIVVRAATPPATAARAPTAVPPPAPTSASPPASADVARSAPSAPRAAPPPPAPALPPAPLEPRLPADPPAPPHHDEHEHFFSSEPVHRPRVTAEWLLQGQRRRRGPR
jgi:predicted Zn finger-like uncharacterized protein